MYVCVYGKCKDPENTQSSSDLAFGGFEGLLKTNLSLYLLLGAFQGKPLKAPGYVHVDASKYHGVSRRLLWRRECHLLLLLLRLQWKRNSAKVSVCQCWLRIGSCRHWRGCGQLLWRGCLSVAVVRGRSATESSQGHCELTYMLRQVLQAASLAISSNSWRFSATNFF